MFRLCDQIDLPLELLSLPLKLGLLIFNVQATALDFFLQFIVFEPCLLCGFAL
jgi:hypothetical protein